MTQAQERRVGEARGGERRRFGLKEEDDDDACEDGAAAATRADIVVGLVGVRRVDGDVVLELFRFGWGRRR